MRLFLAALFVFLLAMPSFGERYALIGGAEGYVIVKNKSVSSPEKMAGLLALGQDKYAAAHGLADPTTAPLPLQIQAGIGYPINSYGPSSITAGVSSEFPNLNGTYVSTAAGQTDTAGCAMVFTNFKKVTQSDGTVRYYADVYKWGGSIAYATSVGNSLQEAYLAIGYSSKDKAPLGRIDVTDISLTLKSTSNDPLVGHGNSTMVLYASYDVPTLRVDPETPTGTIALTKVVQVNDATVGATPDVDYLRSATSISLQVSTAGVAPTYTVGQKLGTTKPAFGTQIGAADNVMATYQAKFNGNPTYFALFAQNSAYEWVFCDFKTLTPYGVFLSEFDVPTPDTTTKTGTLRRTRTGMGLGLKINMSGLSDILSGAGTSTTTGHEAADHQLEIRATNFVGEAPAITTTKYFTDGPPAKFGSTKDPLAIVKDGTKLGSYAFNNMTTADLPFNDTTMTTAVSFDVTPFTLGVTDANGVKTAPLQLSAAITLQVIPKCSWSIAGFLAETTLTPVSLSGTQGVTKAAGNVDFTSDLTVSITNPYPNGHYIVTVTDPKGVTRKIGDGGIIAGTPQTSIAVPATISNGLSINGNYTMSIFGQTPIDTATLASVGGGSYTEPSTPGYGWMLVGNVTFTYNQAVVINGMIITADP